jgi:hypothetical protein
MTDDRGRGAEDRGQRTEIFEVGFRNLEGGMDKSRILGINPFPQATNQTINNLTNIE